MTESERHDESPAPEGSGASRGVVIGLAVAALVLGVAAYYFFGASRGTAPAPAAATGPATPTPAAPTVEPAPAVPPATEAGPRARAPRPAAAPPAAVTPPAPAEAPGETGTLRVESDVTGASVFIDRRFIGTTPVTAEGITPGTHQLNASAEGQEGIVRSIEVEPGPAELMLRFKEVRLSASVDVVHKHAMGSCEGRLVATPEGLRYETSNAKDAFSAKLTDLVEFDVDYLKKNLHIKVRSGKSFNFTDKRENADALFVFHRDVDKARARLASSE